MVRLPGSEGAVLLVRPHLAEQPVQLGDFALAQARERRHDPVFMFARHRGELQAAFFRQAHAIDAPIAGLVDALDQRFLHQLVGDARHVAAADHQPSGQLVHAQTLRRAFELRHQIEARQGGVEAAAQPAAHFAFDQLRAGQQAQPQAQAVRVLGVRAGFQVHRQSSPFAPMSAAAATKPAAASSCCFFCSSR